MHLILVRHGESQSNAEMQFGRRDSPLIALGNDQSMATAHWLGCTANPTAIYTGPLVRALDTARHLSHPYNLDPIVHEDLRESEFGSHEGLTMDEVRKNRPEWWARYQDREDLDLAWPRGETRRHFFDRVNRGFKEILSNETDRDLVIVSHGSVLATYLALLLDGRPHLWRKYHGNNCSVTVLDRGKSPPAILQLNCTSHLSD